MPREEAYRLVQHHAMRAWNEGLNFRELVSSDKEITSRIPRSKLEHAFDLSRQLRNVDKIFARVFGKASNQRLSGPGEIRTHGNPAPQARHKKARHVSAGKKA